MSKVIFSHIALFTANLIYAVNYIVAKDVMPNYVSPAAFIFLRVCGAAMIFGLISIFFTREKIEKKDILYISICAIFGVVVNMLCFFEGLNITTPINASLIMITTPLIVYLISCVFFNQERTYKKLMGVLLGLIGATLLITNGEFKPNFNNMGDLLIFLNAASYAFYLILIKPVMKKYHPITVLSLLFLVGFLIIFPISFSQVLMIDVYIIPRSIIFKILFVIFCTTCIAYFLNIYAISHVASSTVAFYIYLQPLLATLFSIFLGKDFLTSIKLVSAFFIFTGVYFVLKSRST